MGTVYQFKPDLCGLPGKTVARFWEKVSKRGDDDCWQWVGHKSEDGYGRLSVLCRFRFAHRLSWLIHFGYLPKDKFVLHRCDNPSCVNPRHLLLGSQSENMRDCAIKGRLNFQTNRYTNKRRTLPPETTLLIRTALSNGESLVEISRRYGITRVLARSIKNKMVVA